MKYNVMYDVKEEDFESLGMIEEVDSYEDAKALRDELIESPIYCNIEIFPVDEN